MNIKKTILNLLFALILAIPVSAQNPGKITGVVVDAESGETLIGVNVVLILEGTTKGTATDLDGRYTISNITPGTYNIRVTYISYATQIIEGVTVGDGETVRLDISLQEETEMLEEVVVSAGAILNNEAGLLRQRQKSIAFSDAISSEFVSKSGVGDAGAALTKVTGASVVGGKYVYVRGLGDRYSNIQLNGIELPSTDPNRKTFQLDLIPSSLLDNINTLKTFTPDKPGSFSGGIVDINTKSFPEDLQFSISSSITYNTQSSFINDFINGETSDTDFLGYDDGKRSVPDFFNDPELTIPIGPQARFNDSLATILDNASLAFNEEMVPVQRSVPFNYSNSISLGNQFKLFGNDFGYIGSLTYGRTYTFYEGGVTGRYNLTDPENSDELTILQRYDDSQGTDEVNIGGLVNLEYKLSNSQKLGFNFFRSQSGTNVGRIQNGIWPDELGFPQEDLFQQRTNNVLAYTERSLSNYQLSGDHYFDNFLKLKFDWAASYAVTNQNQPDLRFVSYYQNQNFVGADTNNVIRTAGFSFPSRLFRDLEEKNRVLAANFELPFNLLTDQSSRFKFGGLYRDVAREARERFFFIEPSQQIFNQLDGNVEEFFTDPYRGITDVTDIGGGNNRYTFGNVVSDNTQERNNYDADTEIMAVYGMFELPVTERLKFIGGARLEQATLDVVSFDTATTVQDGEEVKLGQGGIDNTDLLPSLSLIYALSDNSNLRFAWTKTIARPNAREIAPFSSFDFIGDFLRVGNTALERTLITNYDVRWELFPRPGEVIAVSAFYKDLENPIELGFRPGAIATNAILQWQNVDQAEILGLEFEIRKNLDFLAEFTKNLSIGANLSLINSNISIPREELAQRPDSSQTTRELQGQSPYIINVNFGYDNLDNGLSAGVYYNVFGRRLSNVGFGTTPDIFEQPRPQLDFVSSKRFGDFTVKFNARNILNARQAFEYDFRNNNEVFQSSRTGVSFTLGVSYSL